MANCLTLLVGRIRLKVPSFKEACSLLQVPYAEPDYVIKQHSAYLAGLVDTDGSIVMNYTGNRVEVNIELKCNEFSKKLDLSKVIPAVFPPHYELIKRNQTRDKYFYSLRFCYNTVSAML